VGPDGVEDLAVVVDLAGQFEAVADLSAVEPVIPSVQIDRSRRIPHDTLVAYVASLVEDAA
jgi:hypothetical protein